jgi:hypothetical protein
MFRSQHHGRPLDTDPPTALELAPVSAVVSYMDCPRCGFGFQLPSGGQLPSGRRAIRHCPRCIARDGLLVELSASELAVETLYERHAGPSGPAHP